MYKNDFCKDVIHGEIEISAPWIFELLKCKEMIRLTKIKQLGLNYRLFPNATHTRYAHSLGTYALANKIINKFKYIFSNKQTNELLAAALLHDCGHGPHSHSWEFYTNLKHEEFTKKIILNKESEVNKILQKYKINQQNVVNILNHCHKFDVLNNIISSQIDVDRLDYLARDSHFTGACYGHIDISMLINWLLIVDNKICFSSHAINSIENFLLARYHMYMQIYEQPKIIAMQALVQKIINRFKYLWHNGMKIVDAYKLTRHFSPWLNNKCFTVNQYLEIDDGKFELFLEQMKFENDEYLNIATNLYLHFLNFDYTILPYSGSCLSAYNAKIKKHTKFPDLYIHKCNIDNCNIYKNESSPILILDEQTKKIKKLQDVSKIIKKLTNIDKTKQLLIINNCYTK